jgi:hypothetical protein
LVGTSEAIGSYLASVTLLQPVVAGVGAGVAAGPGSVAGASEEDGDPLDAGNRAFAALGLADVEDDVGAGPPQVLATRVATTRKRKKRVALGRDPRKTRPPAVFATISPPFGSAGEGGPYDPTRYATPGSPTP